MTETAIKKLIAKGVVVREGDALRFKLEGDSFLMAATPASGLSEQQPADKRNT